MSTENEMQKAKKLVQDLGAANVTVTVNGDQITCKPSRNLTDELRCRIRECKGSLLTILGTESMTERFPTEFYDYTGDWWELMADDNREYATSPAPKERCPWCKRFGGHSEICNELQLSWQVKMPWGRHKGRRLSELDSGYLEWLAGREIDEDLKQAVERELDLRRRQAGRK